MCDEILTKKGCATFYNCAPEGEANTRFDLFFDEDRFEIYALRDIAKDEELRHTYESLKWRGCFKELDALFESRKQQ